MQIKSFFRYLALAGFGCFIAFTLLEFVFQIITPRRLKSKCSDNNERCVFSEYHPLLGYTGRQNIRSTHKGASVTQNSKGYRGADLPYEKAAGVKRVLFIGDSQTWGYRLSDSETLPYRMEKELNAKQPTDSPIKFETLNLGVSGYGTDQAFLSYLLKGRKYRPDLTIYTAFQNDDVESESSKYWGVNKPRFYIKEKQLCLGNVPVPRQTGWYNNSVFPHSWRYLVLPFKSKKFDLANLATLRYFMNREWPISVLDLFTDTNINIVRRYMDCIEQNNGPINDGKSIIKSLIAELHKITLADGGKFLVLFSPHPDDIRNGILRPTDSWGLHEMLQQEQIPMLDITEISIEALKKRNVHYQFPDWHFNPEGTEAVARALYEPVIELTR